LDQPRRRHYLGSQPGRQQPARPPRAARQPGRGGGGRHPGPLLYWANTDGGSNGTINSANLDGTSASAIVTGQNAPAGVAVGSASLYWANPNGGTVNEANLDGGNPHALFANQNASFGVAVGP